MKDAFQLIEDYQKKKNAKPSIAQEFAPILSDLFTALAQIASKELPQPAVTVNQPDIQVSVDAPKIPEIKIPTINLPKPVVNNESYDYTSLLIELKRSVDKLAQIVDYRPQVWEVERNNRGFIEKVKGVSSE